MRLTITFSMDTDKDHDLVRWLTNLPVGSRSKAIREALRAGLGHSNASVADVLQAVQNLERTLQSGAVIAGTIQEDNDTPDEPPDAAANLDKLGL